MSSDMMLAPIEYNQALLTYISLDGDIPKAAAALMCDTHDLARLAKEHDWAARLDRLKTIRRDKGPEAMAKELNRTVNYVQAVQMRQLIDRVIVQLADPAALKSALQVPLKGGAVMFSTKPLEGLAKALETAQRMTYMALGDMITEREAIEERNAGSGTLSILRMLASSTGLKAEATEIMPAETLEKQLNRAEVSLPKASPPRERRTNDSRNRNTRIAAALERAVAPRAQAEDSVEEGQAG